MKSRIKVLYLCIIRLLCFKNMLFITILLNIVKLNSIFAPDRMKANPDISLQWVADTRLKNENEVLNLRYTKWFMTLMY